jgi:DNA-binding transcriptional ArsR family regulator
MDSITEILSNKDKAKLKHASMIFRAINHRLRQEMLNMMKSNGEINVTDLYNQLKIEQSVASQHLRILRDAGLVAFKRDGKIKLYSLNMERLEELVETAETISLKN